MRRTIEFKLKGTASDEVEILKLLDKGKNIYNLALTECSKRLTKLRSDPEYGDLLDKRRMRKKEGKPLPDTDRALSSIVRMRYGLTGTEIEKFVKDHGGYLTYGFHSQFAQNLADRAVDATLKVLYGKSKKVRFKGKFDNILCSVNSKATATGFMFNPSTKTISYRISKKRTLHMPLELDYRNDAGYHEWYLKEIIENYRASGAFDVAYMRIVRRILKGKNVFFVQFVIDVRPYGITKEKVWEENKRILQENSETIRRAVEAGKPANRLRLKHLVPDIVEYPKTNKIIEVLHEAGLYKQFAVSLDLGPKNIAVVLQNERYLIAVLQPLFDKLVEYATELRILQRKLDRQRRSGNPDNYNLDGTIKGKKHMRWHRSRGYSETRSRIRELHRCTRETRKTVLNEFANILAGLGCSFKTEDVSFKAWQKGYGKAMGNYAPSFLQNTVMSKAERAGDGRTKIPLKNALSQLCVCGAKRKKKLSERLHECDCGCKAHRDVLSAYLGLFCSPNLGEWESIARQYHEGDRQLLSASHRVYPWKTASRRNSGFVLCLDKRQLSCSCANEDEKASENHERRGVVHKDSLKGLVGELAQGDKRTVAHVSSRIPCL
jgi:hypothetical protein